MANEEQILIEVKFDASTVEGAKTALAANIKQLKENKAALAELNKSLKENGEFTENEAKQYADLNKKIDENKRAIKSNTAIIQADTQARATENDSLDVQRQYLNTLQKAFAGLTKEQKEAMGGTDALTKYIKDFNDSLAEQEHAIGENGRNVGNYAESMQKAFGEMAHAGELLSPAVSLLRGMGGEGKKAAAALDALSKVMQLAGKAGKVLQSAQQAQAAATQGATVAQEGLNAAMSANPIGLIVAGISTLLPLVQSIVSAFGDATAETEKFNNELERQNRLIEQAQSDAEFEAKVAGIFGASAAEQLRIRKETAKENLRIADEEVERLMQIQITGSKKERTAAAEALKEAQEQQKAAQKALEALNKEATLQDLTDKKKAEDEKTKAEQDAIKKRQEERDKAREDEANAQRDFAIEQMESLRILAEAEAATIAAQTQDALDEARAALANLNEDEEYEEGEEPLTSEEQALKMWGLDSEGLELFKSIMAEGYDFASDKAMAMEDQWKRTSAGVVSVLKNMGAGFSSLGDVLGEFSEESEEAAAAQKAFALIGIITNEAASIAEGALAISEGISSAAGLPFPANIPAIITVTATIAALIAGVASTISQAKALFKQADAGNFAEGGIVGGTSYSGDKLTAHVNSREMILPMDAQKTLFDALSTSNNGDNMRLGFDYELMAAANASLPAPVMVLKELAEEQDKVSTFNEIASV